MADENRQRDPQITDPDAIGVEVEDGAVTLTGHVPSYAASAPGVAAVESHLVVSP